MASHKDIPSKIHYSCKDLFITDYELFVMQQIYGKKIEGVKLKMTPIKAKGGHITLIENLLLYLN